jgi:hypothetical protein
MLASEVLTKTQKLQVKNLPFGRGELPTTIL